MTKTQKINQIIDDYDKSIFNLAKTKKYAKCAIMRKLTYLRCRDRLVDALQNGLKDD